MSVALANLLLVILSKLNLDLEVSGLNTHISVKLISDLNELVSDVSMLLLLNSAFNHDQVVERRITEGKSHDVKNVGIFVVALMDSELLYSEFSELHHKFIFLVLNLSKDFSNLGSHALVFFLNTVANLLELLMHL